MSEKVLGFRNSDSYLAKMGEEGLAWEHYRVGKDKLVPVVSLEEHQKILNAGKFLKLRVIELELELKKRILLEWLEKEIETMKMKDYYSKSWLDDVAREALNNLFIRARKHSGDEK